MNKTKQAMPTTKILISLCTPRNNGLQGASMEVNNILRMNYGGQNRDPRVKLCHHENLQQNGTIKHKLYSGDQYHLNDDGTRMLAANIRYVIEGRRHPPQHTHTGTPLHPPQQPSSVPATYKPAHNQLSSMYRDQDYRPFIRSY